ncbi:MAG: hypothetical protein R2698_02910 [Microthrixaceae bacterium]
MLGKVLRVTQGWCSADFDSVGSTTAESTDVEALLDRAANRVPSSVHWFAEAAPWAATIGEPGRLDDLCAYLQRQGPLRRVA